MAPPNAALNQLKQSLMLKTKSQRESWFVEPQFLLIQGWSCSWGVSLILYGGVNVLGNGMSVWRWGFWTTGLSSLETPAVLL